MAQIPRARSGRLKLLGAVLVTLAVAGPARAAESPFPIRGVIHGAFGSVWTHAERLDMIRWLGAHGMNTFIYMPIEEIHSLDRWRVPFPEEAIKDFKEESRLAKRVGVRWGIGVRPGRHLFQDFPADRDICFSCPEDFQTLAAKYQAFHELGVRVFVVSFDDSAKTSTHPEDVVTFGAGDEAYGRMTADLANRLQARFPDSLVILGPADYSGTQQTDYLKGLAAALSEQVVVYWTGPQIGSRTITAADAEAYSNAISRPGLERRPLIWDNYPNNDLYGEAYSIPRLLRESLRDAPERPPSLRLNFGPLKGRGADLVGKVHGLISNNMNQPHASKVALHTVAAYLSDPESYTSEAVDCAYNPAERTRAGCLAEAAWLQGIRELGGRGADHLLAVVEQMRSTKFDRTEAPRFTALRDALIERFAGPRWWQPWAALVQELEAERAGGRALRAERLPSPEFVEETAHHLDTLELNTRAGLLAARMLAAQRPDVEEVTVRHHGRQLLVRGRAVRADPVAVARHRAELAPAETAMRASPFTVHGDRADAVELVFSGSVFLLENRMDEFVDRAHAETAKWLPLSALAATGPLRVRVDDAPAQVAPDGSFFAEVSRAYGTGRTEVVVEDAAGFSTARTYATGGQD